MEDTTLEYALSVLDSQFGFIPGRGDLQESYYRGMFDMLNIIVSDAFTSSAFVDRLGGKHTKK